MDHRRHFHLSSGQLCGRDIVFHVDSYFNVSLIDSAELNDTNYSQEFFTIQFRAVDPLQLPNGTELTVDGAVCLPIRFRGQYYKQTFMVLKDLSQATEPHAIKALIGSDLLHRLNPHQLPELWDLA